MLPKDSARGLRVVWARVDEPVNKKNRSAAAQLKKTLIPCTNDAEVEAQRKLRHELGFIFFMMESPR
jgi:hypothetical protein